MAGMMGGGGPGGGRGGPTRGRVRFNDFVGATDVVQKKRPLVGKRNTLAKKIRNLGPALHNNVGDSTLNKAMLHNTLYTFGPTQNITQGTGEGNRLGNACHLEALKVAGVFYTPAAGGNGIEYRIIIGFHTSKQTAPTSFVSGLGLTDIAVGTTGGTWTPALIVNPKSFTVLDDRVLDINSNIASTQDIITFNYTVQIQQRFEYQQNDPTFGKTKNLYVVVVAAIPGGVTGTTACGQVYMNADLIFKHTN